MTEKKWGCFESFVDQLMQEQQVPGTIVAVAEAGAPVYTRGFGFRDREQSLPVTEQTVFGIASVTKSFTALAIMQLVDDDALSLSDRVCDHLAPFDMGQPEKAQHITVQHLLTHTSGLPPLPTLDRSLARTLLDDPAVKETPQYEQLKKLEPIDTYKELLDFINSLDVELLGWPGEYTSYSNDAYALLGYIIEEVSGQSYASFIKERILDPLGMEHTTFDPDIRDSFSDLTTIYDRQREDNAEHVVASPQWLHAPAHLPAGMLCSNAADMLRYLELYRRKGLTPEGKRIISTDAVSTMLLPHSRWRHGAHYGYGFNIHPNYHGFSLIEHAGGLKGVSANVGIVPEKGITAVVLSNLAGGHSGRIMMGSINTMLELPVDTPVYDFPDYHCPAERLSRYTGKYISPEGSALAVSATEDGLQLAVDGVTKEAAAVGIDQFALKLHGKKQPVIFLNDPAGEVWAVFLGGRIVRKTGEAD